MADDKLDLDAAWAAKRAAEGKPETAEPVWAVVHLGGQDLRVQAEPNAFIMFQAQDGTPGAGLKAILGYFHPQDQGVAQMVLERMPDLDGDKLNWLIDHIQKATVGRPTQPSPSSGQLPVSTGPSSTDGSSSAGVPPVSPDLASASS